jgi:hypothetical protein
VAGEVDPRDVCGVGRMSVCRLCHGKGRTVGYVPCPDCSPRCRSCENCQAFERHVKSLWEQLQEFEKVNTDQKHRIRELEAALAELRDAPKPGGHQCKQCHQPMDREFCQNSRCANRGKKAA